jgi:hypothetical protein
MLMENLLLISFLVIVWWIALWGLIEIVLKSIVGNSVGKTVIAYSLMIAFVLLIVYIYPGTMERFL